MCQSEKHRRFSNIAGFAGLVRWQTRDKRQMTGFSVANWFFRG
jgi:hypothetical protein